MKKITFKNLVNLLKSNGLLAVAGGLLLMSCGSQMGYTETDGVYYDPSRDTLPEGTVMNSGNRVGEYYDYQATDSTNKYLNTDNRNENWRDNSTSDWGNYNGTDTYYNDSSWGYPYGFYSGFGFGMSFGWGSSFGFGGMYDPWGYNPYYGYYSPFYGYHNPYYGYYSPYYGYYNPYYGYSPYGNGYYNSYNGGFINKRSGSDGSFNNRRNSSNNVRSNNSENSGFRNNPSNTGIRNNNNN